MDDRPTVVSPLAVVTKVKRRLILDLSRLNKSLAKTTIRYEDIASVWELATRRLLGYFRPSQWVPSLDGPQRLPHLSRLQMGRVFLPVQSSSFRSFPTAPFVFTKVFRSLTKKWRAQGICVTLYLDDGIVLAETSQECARTSRNS